MKKLIIVLFMMISIGVFAQTTPLAIRMDLVTRLTYEEKGYLQQGVGTLTIKVNPYIVKRVESSGQLYIEFTNSRLTTSRMYLGWAWGVHEYEDNTIFFNKDTTRCWIFSVDRYGQIFKMDLPDSFSDDARIIK